MVSARRMNAIAPHIVDDIVVRALQEDLAAGDLTTESCIAPDARCTALGVARKPMVFCGAQVVRQVFRHLDTDVAVEPVAAEGAKVSAGATLFRLLGSARSVLMGERVALNLVQRMSGVSTLTRAHVDAVSPGSTTRVTDTRKTTPGLRALERYAVRMGGGHNHRDNLGAAVLIKDNHIVAAGGITLAIRRAKDRAPHTSRIECEVDTLAGLEEAMAAGADIVLLDNMDDDTVRRAVAMARGKVLTEASGGITLDRIAALSSIGVDYISVGALTHSAPAVDIGLDFS